MKAMGMSENEAIYQKHPETVYFSGKQLILGILIIKQSSNGWISVDSSIHLGRNPCDHIFQKDCEIDHHCDSAQRFLFGGWSGAAPGI